MSDMKPDAARAAIIDIALKDAVFDGWTDVMLDKAAIKAGLPDGAAKLYFPGGIMDALLTWSKQMDEAARIEIEKLDLEAMKIRDRVTEAVIIRLSRIGDHEDAARRANARLALPDGVSTAASLGWAASDMIWRAIGDESTDFNYYSKRTILSAVLASTASVWLNDPSPDKSRARAFLDRRIQNVMQFESVKAQVRDLSSRLPDPADVLSRLRDARTRRSVPTRRQKRRVRRGG